MTATSDYGITCPNCDGEDFAAADHYDGGRDYICQTCGHVVVVDADSV